MEGRKTIGDGFSLDALYPPLYPGSRSPSFDISAEISSSPTFRQQSKLRAALSSHRSASSSTGPRSRTNSPPPSSIPRSSCLSSSVGDDFLFLFSSEGERERELRLKRRVRERSIERWDRKFKEDMYIGRENLLYSLYLSLFLFLSHFLENI